MELAKWISFVILLASSSGQEEGVNPDTQNYRYNYFVRDETTGDVKSHEEQKTGDTVVGQYSVGEPTGDLRVVTYTADEGGFRANVKYEEGGSPLSDIRDKERQVSPTSGFQFEWLPANPDDIATGGKDTSNESGEDSEKTNLVEDEGSAEGKQSTESVEAVSVQAEETSESSGGSSSNEETTPGNKGEDSSSEESGEKSQSDSSSESPPEEKDESESKSSESESKESDEGSAPAKEGSPEAAESAHSQSAAPTEQNNVYLPPMPSLPFYNVPPQPPLPESDRSTIIYASQNFYNPWQWFGTNKIQQEPKDEPQAHYMTGLGYIIMPPRPQQ